LLMLVFFLQILRAKRIPLGNDTIFFEPFDSIEFPKNWVRSKDPKYDGQYKVRKMAPPRSLHNEQMLTFITKKKFYVLSSKIDSFPKMEGKEFVFQFESRHPEYIDCTGGFMKLFGDIEPIVITEKTPALLTFGPEMCGDVSHVIFKFRHLNKKTRIWSEISLIDPPPFEPDGLNQLFTLVIRPNNTYEILINGETVKKGSLYEDFDPPINGYIEVPDPDDFKPDDWDEREYIIDEAAVKPDDWDENAPLFIQSPPQLPEGWQENEPLYIEDRGSKKPSAWSDEILGEYKYPLIENPKCFGPNSKGCGKYTPGYIKNPNYKGEWNKPLIRNPNYKGKWKQKMIPNKDYSHEPKAYLLPRPGAIGFNFWSADANIAFKNILISNKFAVVKNTTIRDFLKRRESQLKREIEKAEIEMNKLEEEREEQEEREREERKKPWFQRFIRKIGRKAFNIKEENL
jgi:calnexin